MLVSPFCVWELLTHLEERGKFEYFKKHLMKLRYVTILDDPYTSVERLVVLSTDDIHQHVPDSNIIYAMLAALRDSASIVEFYEKQIEDECGELRQITQCGQVASQVLREEEERFAKFVGNVVAAAFDGHVSLRNAEDRHEAALNLLHGWWLQLGGRVEFSRAARERFVRLMYVYCSFVVHRAVHYKETKATIQNNDFEDARFCMHLGLDLPYVAVTDDSSLRRALQDSIGTLNSLTDLSWRSSLTVLRTGDFWDRLGDAD